MFFFLFAIFTKNKFSIETKNEAIRLIKKVENDLNKLM